MLSMGVALSMLEGRLMDCFKHAFVAANQLAVVDCQPGRKLKSGTTP